MNNDIAIRVNNLTKIYHLYDKPKDRLKEALNPFKKSYHHDFYAMNDVSFEIKKGETVGIVGKNGAGKSTLLKMITGVLTPTSGTIEVEGKIASLLELGAGFNPEMTGIENIYLNGTLMGLTREEMASKVEAILAFADIGAFVYQPVKSYSSGMSARLAFAVAINIDPEILIVDEVLSVGDMVFQAKSILKMKTLIEDNETTVLFVSHDMGTVKSICEKALYIDNGRLIDFDSSTVIVEAYIKNMISQIQYVTTDEELLSNEVEDNELKHDLLKGDKQFLERASFCRIQNGKAHFVNMVLLNSHGDECKVFEFAEEVTLRMVLEVNEGIEILGHGYFLRDSNGINLVYSDSLVENCSFTKLKSKSHYLIDWKFELKLTEGDYTIATVLGIPLNTDQFDFCDYVPLAVQFSVCKRKPYALYGKTSWKNSVKIEQFS